MGGLVMSTGSCSHSGACKAGYISGLTYIHQADTYAIGFAGPGMEWLSQCHAALHGVQTGQQRITESGSMHEKNGCMLGFMLTLQGTSQRDEASARDQAGMMGDQHTQGAAASHAANANSTVSMERKALEMLTSHIGAEVEAASQALRAAAASSQTRQGV